MSDFVKVIKAFIYRDLTFIFGGTLVLLSVGYATRSRLLCIALMSRELPVTTYFLFAAIAYVIGYLVQDIGGIARITPTGHPFQPRRFFQWIYERFSKWPWEETSYLPKGWDRFKFEIGLDKKDIPEATLANLERIIFLKMIGMCVGGCSVISFFILFIRLIFISFSIENLFLVIASFFSGFFLICLGWLKGMQQMCLYQALSETEYPPRHSDI